jgi:hypothetical protein
MMLSTMSSATTPGDRPAPETPCIDVMSTRCSPNRSSKGFRVTTSPMVVQFGSGVMNPRQFRRRRCRSMSLACDKLTPGTMIGTSSS